MKQGFLTNCCSRENRELLVSISSDFQESQYVWDWGVCFGRVLGVFGWLGGFLSISNCLLLCYELKLFLKGRKIQQLFAY